MIGKTKRDFKFNQDEKDEPDFNYYLIIYLVLAFFVSLLKNKF